MSLHLNGSEHFGITWKKWMHVCIVYVFKSADPCFQNHARILISNIHTYYPHTHTIPTTILKATISRFECFKKYSTCINKIEEELITLLGRPVQRFWKSKKS